VALIAISPARLDFISAWAFSVPRVEAVLLALPFALSSEQLPINIQLVSRWLDEATILRLGALLERSGGLGERHPSI